MRNNWKAPHKAKASDKMCSIFILKKQMYACIHYCLKQAEIIHTIVKQMTLHYYCVDCALYAIMHAYIIR